MTAVVRPTHPYSCNRCFVCSPAVLAQGGHFGYQPSQATIQTFDMFAVSMSPFGHRVSHVSLHTAVYMLTTKYSQQVWLAHAYIYIYIHNGCAHLRRVNIYANSNGFISTPAAHNPQRYGRLSQTIVSSK